MNFKTMKAAIVRHEQRSKIKGMITQAFGKHRTNFEFTYYD